MPLLPGPPPPAMPDDVDAAIAVSKLRHLPDELRVAMIADAVRVHVPAGATVRREGQPGPHIELVVSGLVRMYLGAPDGRTQTIRYCRPGALMGAGSLYVAGFAMRTTIEALLPSDLLALRPGVVRGLADTHLPVALVLLEEISERAWSFVGELHQSAFATVRQRLVRHLLDIASEDPAHAELSVAVSQQELADAVGTVREVIARVLRDLREEGIVETGRDRIVITNPDRLLTEMFPGLPHPGSPPLRTQVTH